MITRRVVMCGIVVLAPVPNAVEGFLGGGALALDGLDQAVGHRAGVLCLAGGANPQGVQDQWFLFVDHFGQIAQLLGLKGGAVEVDVDAALGVDLGPGLADGAHDRLQLVEVVVVEDGADDLGAQVFGDAGQ